MRLDLLRHGAVDGGRKYRGHGVDDPLSPSGWRQLEQATARDPGWSAIASSPLTRCARFAHTLAERLQCPLQLEPDLREVGFGQWEGMSRERLEREQPQALQAFLADPVRHRPPGAEPLDQLIQRVGRVLDRLAANPGERWLVLAHAGVIRAALAHTVALPPASLYRVEIRQARFTSLTWTEGRWSLLGINLPEV